jgi:hypothetical protein
VITQVEAASGNECPVKVIPNPANRYVQLSLMENNLPRSVKLFDANGRLLIQMDDFNGGEAKINIQDLAEGIYYLKVVFAHSAQMLKLVKISNREN